MNKRTVRRYFNNDAAVCPNCGGSDYTGHAVEFDGLRMYQEITCNECPAEFLIAASIDAVITLKRQYDCNWIDGKPVITTC